MSKENVELPSHNHTVVPIWLHDIIISKHLLSVNRYKVPNNMADHILGPPPRKGSRMEKRQFKLCRDMPSIYLVGEEI